MPKRKLTKGKSKIVMSEKPHHRTSSLKQVRKRTPGGKVKIVYKHKRPGKHVCAICKEVLHGKPRGRPVEIRKLSKSERRPERPFGGMLCSKCSRKIISLRAKLKHGLIKKEEIPISLSKYM